MSASKSYQFPIPDFLGVLSLTIRLPVFDNFVFLDADVENLIGFNPAFLLPLLIALFVLSDIFAIGNQGVSIIKNDGFSQKKLNHKPLIKLINLKTNEYR